jgi:hypothetical protein
MDPPGVWHGGEGDEREPRQHPADDATDQHDERRGRRDKVAGDDRGPAEPDRQGPLAGVGVAAPVGDLVDYRMSITSSATDGTNGSRARTPSVCTAEP